MPPRKSDRVRAIKEKLGQPSYSETSRRCSSVGPTSARPNARRSSIRSATTDHNVGGRETPNVPTREKLHQLEKSSRNEPEQYPGNHDLSQLVEEQSRQLDDAPGRGGSPEEVPGMESVLRRTQVQSENQPWLHRQESEPSTSIAARAGTSAVQLVSRTNPQEPSKSSERALSETSSRRGGIGQHAVDAVLQPSLLPGDQRDQQIPEEQRKVSLSYNPKPTGTVQPVEKTFISTPSPFLFSQRVAYENNNDVFCSAVMMPTPVSKTSVLVQKVAHPTTSPLVQNDVTPIPFRQVVSPKVHALKTISTPMTENDKIERALENKNLESISQEN
ncbi:uncharacterized protein MELLADRAFT_69459 [Melampsora larici-populina 98AG31]|uniref:Uncharacterized protein n=1 Tax=Melampsora larici-populina (strain 98AG31 / pathotype 3-4-7) TaxID=747676 RepID=F4SAU7_MELLP|nr:uncharacterized protein MELLADRAFT_69459 [Melampsora larici-populina 98AG31]EGF98227.1 hypothetical protein MELLADRAFT_69459 [Melampsora larici-populina 98AG31]